MVGRIPSAPISQSPTPGAYVSLTSSKWARHFATIQKRATRETRYSVRVSLTRSGTVPARRKSAALAPGALALRRAWCGARSPRCSVAVATARLHPSAHPASARRGSRSGTGITRHERYASVWFCARQRRARRRGADAHRPPHARGHRGRVRGGRVVSTALERVLAARPGALVIVDNLEHLLPAAAPTLRSWVTAAPDVRFVVTSRVPLGDSARRRSSWARSPSPPPAACRASRWSSSSMAAHASGHVRARGRGALEHRRAGRPPAACRSPSSSPRRA